MSDFVRSTLIDMEKKNMKVSQLPINKLIVLKVYLNLLRTIETQIYYTFQLMDIIISNKIWVE